MLFAPFWVRPGLMPSMSEYGNFVPDMMALTRQARGQEDAAGLEAATALTNTPEFLEQVKLCARTLRPLIRRGGITPLPKLIGGDQARSAKAGSLDSNS